MKPYVERPHFGRLGRIVGLLLNTLASVFALLVLLSGVGSLISDRSESTVICLGLGASLLILCLLGFTGPLQASATNKASHTHR